MSPFPLGILGSARVPAAGGPLAFDDFTGSNGSIAGRTTGSFTWENDTQNISLVGTFAPKAGSIVGNRWETPTAETYASVINIGVTAARAECDFGVSALSSARIRIGVAAAAVGNINNYHGVNLTYINGEGFYLFYGTGGAPTAISPAPYTGAGTGVLTGTMSVEWDGTTATAKYNGTTIISGAVSGVTGTYVTIASLLRSGNWADNLTVTAL